MGLTAGTLGMAKNTITEMLDLMAGSTRFELATSGLTVQCANQAAPRARDDTTRGYTTPFRNARAWRAPGRGAAARRRPGLLQHVTPFTLRHLRARANRQQLKADFEACLDGLPNVRDILHNFEFRNQGHEGSARAPRGSVRPGQRAVDTSRNQPARRLGRRGRASRSALTRCRSRRYVTSSGRATMMPVCVDTSPRYVASSSSRVTAF